MATAFVSREIDALALGDQLTLDAVRLFDVFGLGQGLLVAVVPDGNVGARLCIRMGYGQADASTGARDDGGPALEREERQDAVALWNIHVVMAERAVLHVGHCV